MWEIQRIASYKDYDFALVPNHPNAMPNGYVLAHRAIMENLIGRVLNSDEIVHHINGNGHDNRIENIEIMDRAEHSRMHMKNHGIRYVLLLCPECGKIFVRERRKSHLVRKHKIATTCSNKCGVAFGHKRRKMPNAEMQNYVSANAICEFIA